MARWTVLLAAGLIATGLPATTGQNEDQPVVVLLHDHSQDAVLSALAGTTPTHVTNFAVGNAFSATVSRNQETALARNPAVAEVIPDVTLHVRQPKQSVPTMGKGTLAACPAQPVEPEALTSIHADRTDLTGTGVKIGYIADGIDPNNADFVRADGSHAITSYVDFSGGKETFGEEAFGDASSISAQGLVEHDLSAFVNPAHPLPAGCDIRLKGVAPGADLVAINAFDGPDTTTMSKVLQAIDYAVSVAHVSVLNESFGSFAYPDAGSRDAIEQFNDKAVVAGVTVLTASGDAGGNNTVNSPAADPNVISVGATTDYQFASQIGDRGAPLGHGWVSDNIATLSSGGFTQEASTIDLVAPGDANWSACTASKAYSACLNETGKPSDIRIFGGTSEATPLTAGVVALVIQAYRSAHGGQSPTPAQVKQLLTGTAGDLGVAAQYEGAGLLNAEAAVDAARHGHLLLSKDKLTGTGQPGSTRTDQIDVTNTSGQPLLVNAGMHDYTDIGPAAEHDVTLDPKADPTFAGADGTPQAYRKTTFTVDPGTDVLTVNAAWPGVPPTEQSLDGIVSISLYDPAGRLVMNSNPEGAVNHAAMLVRKPTPGTWTAAAFTEKYSGVVKMTMSEQRATAVRGVNPPVFALLPGQHRTVEVTSVYPATGGDSAHTITFSTAAGTTAVADVLRTVIPLTGGKGTFAGSITGGNGRGGDPAQSNVFTFDVPKGAPGLNVAVTLADTGDVLAGALIDPNGETPSIGTNYAAEQTNTPEKSLGLSVTDPIPGRWRFVLAANNPVSGKDIATPYTGTIRLHSGVTVSGQLPTQLSANTPHTATLTVTNTSPATVYVQTDARTSTVQDIQLKPRNGVRQPVPDTVQLPMQGFDLPAFLVPPQTSALTVTSTSTVSNQVELAPAGAVDDWGAVDAIGNQGTTSTSTVSERNGFVAHGDWLAGVTEIGPFGTGGEPQAQATLGVTAHTLGFDPTVTSSTGDPYAESTNPAADPGKPLAIAPGAAATITVTITPTAAPGTTVTGSLDIVTPGDATEFGRIIAQPVATTGDLLATVPYSYTVTS